MVDWILWDVTRQAIERTDDYVVIHAAAAAANGKGILMPGPSGSGKTTLLAGLVAAGFQYLTDEAALIHPQTARLHPFPRPLHLRPPSVRELVRMAASLGPLGDGQSHLGPDDIRPGALGEACSVKFVVFPRYEPSTGTTLEPISRASALMSLADNCLNVAGLSADGVATLATVVREAACFRLLTDNLEAAVRIVTQVAN
jgi:hypothetical protein